MQSEISKLTEGWSFSVLLKGHSAQIEFYLTEAEKDDLIQSIHSQDEQEFVVFNTTSHRVAILLEDLLVAQFLSEFLPPILTANAVDDKDGEFNGKSRVFFRGASVPMDLDLAGDLPEDNSEQSASVIESVFCDLELGGENCDLFRLDGADGETIFLRRGGIAILEAPLSYLRCSAAD